MTGIRSQRMSFLAMRMEGYFAVFCPSALNWGRTEGESWCLPTTTCKVG